jgi:hypothetical protein
MFCPVSAHRTVIYKTICDNNCSDSGFNNRIDKINFTATYIIGYSTKGFALPY